MFLNQMKMDVNNSFSFYGKYNAFRSSNRQIAEIKNQKKQSAGASFIGWWGEDFSAFAFLMHL